MSDQDGRQPLSEQASSEVAEFYDAHPYPPPVSNLDHYIARWQDEERRRADHYLFLPDTPYRDNPSVLVAGCGTSQAAKYALRQPNSQVTGIDLSAAGVRHTEKLKEKYGLTNLEVRRLPIESVGELGRTFDKIVSTGVLHHLPDPARGLRALREVLRPDGVLHLMVYATYGRTGVYMIQEYARRLGIGNSDAEIDDLAKTLMALPQDHPLARLLGESPDFRSKAGLADALLHPQDRSYTAPELFDFLAGCGFAFGRWARQAPYLAGCGDVAKTPHSARLLQLAPEQQYAAVELLRGTMARHSVIAYRNDQPAGRQPTAFDKRWLRYTPMRLPDTVIVRERLPAGAAAVLINTQHSYHDLYLPVTASEQTLFDSIDGRRTIGEILDSAASDSDSKKAEFFHRLWQYDQIALNASMPTG